MADVLGDLWVMWSGGTAGGQLPAALTVAVLAWLVALVASFVHAHRQWRSPARVTLLVALLPFAFAGLGTAQPSAWPWWVVGGCITTAIVTLILLVTASAKKAVCDAGHSLVRDWSFCPACASPLAAIPALGPTVGGGWIGTARATLLRRRPPVDTLDRQHDVGTAPEGAFVWLIPDADDRAAIGVPGPGAVVGRSPEAHVHIDDPMVSWQHARIVSRDGAPALVDLGSSNGTFVNGERVHESMLLSDDTVRFGSSTFRVRRG